jgi:hypothetical protein
LVLLNAFNVGHEGIEFGKLVTGMEVVERRDLGGLDLELLQNGIVAAGREIEEIIVAEILGFELFLVAVFLGLVGG